VPVRRLKVPDGFASLPKVREAVLEDLETSELVAALGDK
jgi:hypothetical protein